MCVLTDGQLSRISKPVLAGEAGVAAAALRGGRCPARPGAAPARRTKERSVSRGPVAASLGRTPQAPHPFPFGTLWGWHKPDRPVCDGDKWSEGRVGTRKCFEQKIAYGFTRRRYQLTERWKWRLDNCEIGAQPASCGSILDLKLCGFHTRKSLRYFQRIIYS